MVDFQTGLRYRVVYMYHNGTFENEVLSLSDFLNEAFETGENDHSEIFLTLTELFDEWIAMPEGSILEFRLRDDKLGKGLMQRLNTIQ